MFCFTEVSIWTHSYLANANLLCLIAGYLDQLQACSDVPCCQSFAALPSSSGVLWQHCATVWQTYAGHQSHRFVSPDPSPVLPFNEFCFRPDLQAAAVPAVWLDSSHASQLLCWRDGHTASLLLSTAQMHESSLSATPQIKSTYSTWRWILMSYWWLVKINWFRSL